MAAGRNMLFVIPAPGFGHIGSNTMLAAALLRHSKSFTITMLLIDSPYGDERGVAKKLATSNPDINFVHVPLAENSPGGKCYPEHVESHKDNVAEVVKSIVLENDKVWFILDMFCSSMIDVANELDAKCYMYCTTSAAFLGLCNFFPSTRPVVEGPVSRLEWLVSSYITPVPTSALPDFAYSESNHFAFSKTFKQFGKMKGMIVNTFAELEPYALRSFLDLKGFPPVYPVGPLVDLTGENQVSTTNKAESDRILSWLGGQEKESVVFLCFGREGCFTTEQVREIALGLEASGVKFLWALRKQVSPGGPLLADMEDPSKILPEGFLSRIGTQGVVCGWAPQTEILGHPAVGGFVTHCGWKSILESIWFGVPTAAWPLYAEQQMNAFYMVKELKLAVELKIDYRINQEELVQAETIQNAVKSLMGIDGSNKELRKRVKEISQVVRTVANEGGSTFETRDRLIFDMLGPDLKQEMETTDVLE